MKITLLAVGKKMPDWVNRGFAEYAKRLPGDFSLHVKEVPLVRRSGSITIDQCIDKESAALLDLVSARDYLAALDVKGNSYDTTRLAERIRKIQEQGRNLCLLVGGPDGLSVGCLQRADELWSLSALTLPHPLVRVLVAEQLYRVWSVLNHHPYHRE
jgi:23S rRNA (pseudouridine1915-N3)-methyltransferase